MKQYTVPLFVPFNVRNQIINENCTKQKDINEIPLESQYSILKSYMKESKIYDGIQKRNLDILRGKSKNSLMSYGAYSKPYSPHTLEIPQIKYSPNHGNAFLSFGFDDTDLKSYWKFNAASGDIINQSQSAAGLGSAADLQVTGATFGQTGIIGDALLFDGVDDEAEAGTSASQYNFMHNTTALWTLASWLKFPVNPPANTSDRIFDNSSITTGVNFQIATINRITMQIRASGGITLNFTTTSNSIPTDLDWHFYTFTYDQSLGSNNMNARVDDVSEGTGNKTATTPVNTDAAGPFTVGAREDATSFLNVIVDETSIWNKVMSAPDITSLYNNGAGLEIY